MTRLLVGLAVLAPLAGAATTAPVPVHLTPKEPPLYHPTRVGAKWVYQTGVKGVFGEIELTRSITAVKRTDAGLLVMVSDDEPNGETPVGHKLLVTPAGLAGVEGKPSSPQWMLKIPCVAGEKWDVDSSFQDFVCERQYTALGIEEVEVPAGKFSAVRVRSVLVWGQRGGRPLATSERIADSWYAPGVGLIKVQYGRLPPCLVLKSFTP